MGSKTVLVGKLALVFFISLLSFSIGTFVGKKFSDNQHQLAALEPNKKGGHTAAAHGDEGAHADAPHGENAHAEVAHGEGDHGAPQTEVSREVASEGGPMSDEEIAKLAEEFVADDTHTVTNKDAHANGHAKNDDHAAVEAHAAVPAAHSETPGQNTVKPQAAQKKSPASVQSEVTHAAPAAKLREHNPPIAETRVPTSLPKDVGQFQPAKFTVQVAAYTDEGEAKKLATDLKGQGYSAFYVPSIVKGKTYYRVSVGQFATQQEASLFRAELVEKAKVGTAFVQKITQ